MVHVQELITRHLEVWTDASNSKNSGARRSQHFEVYGLKKLRELILEFAVRGLLVSQDSHDEPASELLRRVASETATQVREGKVKKTTFAAIRDEEVPHRLPRGWAWSRLGVLGNIFSGTSINAGVKEERYTNVEGLPFIATKDVGYGFDALDYENGVSIPSEEPGFRVARAGAVLMCAEGGSAGRKCGITDRDICFGNKLFANELRGGIPPEFVLAAYLTPTFFHQLSHELTGIIGGISSTKFSDLLVAVAPLQEQHRIVAKLRELMALCDRLEEQIHSKAETHDAIIGTLLSELVGTSDHRQFAIAWSRIVENFDMLFSSVESTEHLQQAILQLAVTGRLVRQDPNDEPASELLKKIAAEKRELVAAGRAKNHPPVEPLGKPQSLPSTWKEIVVQDFADVRLGSTPSRTEPKYWKGDIPWVSSGEVADCVIRDTAEKITKEGFENSSTSMIPARSLLMAIIGQGKTRGQTALLEIDACTNQNVAAFVFNEKFVCPEYVWLWARSKYESHRDDGHGGAQPALNGKKVRSFRFPLAPIAEQRRIVQKVEELMKICVNLRTQISNRQATKLHLADAIVATALASV